jgi:protein-disulfide isomerase
MNKNRSLGISIILIGVIVAIGIYISRIEPKQEFELNEIDYNIIEVNPISEDDYILGSPNAKIIVIEYTHFECPFSRVFHSTMRRIIDDYGHRGEVAWVIRHLPIPELYPNSYQAAVAIECVTNINKDDRGIFWQYTDSIVNSTGEIDALTLREIAISIGTDPVLYDSCVISNKYDHKIKTDVADAQKLIEADINFMTPYSLIIANTGLQTRISGSIEYLDLKEIIDEMLARIY